MKCEQAFLDVQEKQTLLEMKTILQGSKKRRCSGSGGRKFLRVDYSNSLITNPLPEI